MTVMTIFVSTSFVGFHKWDNAPEKTSFLRNKHRHVFFVKVWLKVYNDDRELEFFDIKEELERYIKRKINKEDVGSCEMIAKELSRFHERVVAVEVSEDNENGVYLVEV